MQLCWFCIAVAAAVFHCTDTVRAVRCGVEGKLRRSEQQHTVSSSLTPQPPRSQSFSHHTGGESADHLATHSGSVSGAMSMPGHAAARRQGTRTSLFSPAAASEATAGSQYQSFSPEDLSPPATSAVPGARHVGGFNTPQRPGPARFMGASPRRGGAWSPAPTHQLTTLPTIGSEDSWDQNAQLTPSPVHKGPLGGVGTMGTTHRGLAQQQVTNTPVQPLPQVGGLQAAWAASPGSQSSMRGPSATPRAALRPPPAAVTATPRGAVYISQQGALNPGFYASRTGNLVSGSIMAGGGGEGDTVSGVLELLGGQEGGGDSRLQPHISAALSGFSSDSSSLAGTPDGSFGLQYQGGYFTPVRPNRGAAAALLPASARPASRTAMWAATPAVSGRNIPPGTSGSGFFAVSGTGHAGAAAAAAAHHQVPDTPLLKAGRNIAGAMFSPAPPMPLSMQHQQQQRIMSTPSHIQSLLPPPGSASKLKPAAALLASAAVTGAAGDMHPAGSSANMSAASGRQQSSAAAAAALLQPSPDAPSSSTRPLTPQLEVTQDHPGVAGSSALTTMSSCVDTQPLFLHSRVLSEEDMHTPVQSPRASTPTGTPGGSTVPTGSGSGGTLFSPAPPPAPARPVPGVVLVPAMEAAESLYGSEEGFGEGFMGEGYMGQGFIPEGYEGEEFEDGESY